MAADTDKKWAIDAEARLNEFDHQYSRLVGEGVVRHVDRDRVKADWVRAKFPPVVTFIRQHASAAVVLREDA